jgi:diguanylate cyclase (GGDEF)-like protein/putative nucleotidyltransferase with HDIG domain
MPKTARSVDKLARPPSLANAQCIARKEINIRPRNGGDRASDICVKPRRSTAARVYRTLLILAGAGATGLALSRWECADPARFVCYLMLVTLAASLRVSQPGVSGTLSAGFLFLLIGIVELSRGEAMTLGAATVLVECFYQARRPRLEQLLFHVAAMEITVWLCDAFYHRVMSVSADGGQLPALALTASLYFLAKTMQAAGEISLTEGTALHKVWRAAYLWSFAYYLAGSLIAWMLRMVCRAAGWQSSVVALPIVYFIYRSYRFYLGRLEEEKKQVGDMADLHLRTIEALALAIEAKDHTMRNHLRRVGLYAVEVGKEMGLRGPELEALRAAALLHDVGKLAVPDHILSKPGKVTPEEFEKIKIHAAVGAEILEGVEFPYPVAPLVRAHHERWDGTGYPDGLRGEEIPMGSRILAAVDALDALASDRQYRRALTLPQAMRHVASRAGADFDPQVVRVLQRRYLELERLACQERRVGMQFAGEARASARHKSRTAPGAPARVEAAPETDFLSSIAAARQEAQMLFELRQDLGNSLSLDETLSVLDARLNRLIPHDSIAIYLCREGALRVEYASGEDFRLFSSLEIPVGEGVSGWVAKNRAPILNGHPSAEASYLGDPRRFSILRSAMAVPLEGPDGLLGVLTLYHGQQTAFTSDHLRILLAVSDKVALTMDNALKYRQAESSATTDYLTELPNARSLFLHLDSELARARRMGTTLAVLVTDLNGFKQFNDCFGHLEGNKMLRAVARVLRENCREYDYAARLGGDEFVLVLPHITLPALEARVDLLRAQVSDAGKKAGEGADLSLSVGAALYPADGADAEQLLAEADRRMYQNKRQHAQGQQIPDSALDTATRQ